MTNDSPAKGEGRGEMEIPPVTKGYKRQWVRCKQCGRVAYYDFVPYSLSSPILIMPCNHGPFGHVIERITDVEAEQALNPYGEYGYA